MSFGNSCSVLSHNLSWLLSEMGAREQANVYLSLGIGRKEATEEGVSLPCCELVEPLKYHQASLFQRILLESTLDPQVDTPRVSVLPVGWVQALPAGSASPQLWLAGTADLLSLGQVYSP